MSYRLASSPLHRRTVLKLFLSSGLGLGLAACGGGSGDSAQDRSTALLKTEAEAAVASGLVGMARAFSPGMCRRKKKNSFRSSLSSPSHFAHTHTQHSLMLKQLLQRLLK
ncbi:MAG: hypothetical protein J0L85_15455, partial [Zoogloea sp.]|nr:hypothetical protein [Zoogloea sp.]